MKAAKYVLGAAIALVAPVRVRANSIVFNAFGTFSNGSTLTGTVTIDTTLGNVTAASLFTTTSGAAGPFTLTSQGVDPSGNYSLVTSYPGTFFQLILNFSTGTLVGYAGGPFCSGTTLCNALPNAFEASQLQSGAFQVFLSTGGLTVPAPTPAPEPSSAILLGTGILGLMGMGLYKKRLA